MVEGDVPTRFKSTTIFSLDLAQLVAGTQFRGQFESRLTSMIDTVKEGEKDIILFVDEIHMLLGAGAVEGGMDAANILKPALSRGEIQCIGATTEKEYTKYIEADAAFDRRFQKIEIVQPSITNTIEIMEGLRDLYEEYHGVEISNDALRTTVELADRYLPEQFLPDKAINLIDDACVSAKEEYGDSGTPILQEFRVELEETIQKKKKAIQNNKFEIAQECRNSEVNLKIQIKAILGLENEDKSADIIVTEEHVAKALSEMTRIPVAKLTKTESEKLLQMEKVLHSRVVGQDEAVVTIAKAMRRARVGINNPTRPIASLMFCGPTGVGKTELTKALATHFFDSEDALVRLDMSEYMEAHTVSKLIGSPPGFVGFDQGGQLTEKVRKNPYCVVLFDEIEKAHPEIFNLMLQIFDDGRLTDSQGRTVRFNESIIILTSNVGAGAIQELQSDFTKATYTGKSLYEQLKDKVLEKLKETFRPEFINRLDDIIVFKRLTKYQIEEIAAISLKQIRKRLLTGKNIFLEFTRKFKNKLLDEGYDPVYGARPLRRAVTKLLVDPLAESYLNEKIKDGQHVLVNFDGQKTIFNADLFLWPEEGDWRWNRI
jgi:ATP-dependent Clp protease ATP-binding subunit ClpC